MSTRQVTEARVLAALAHPLRSRLLDVFKVHGPATVGGLAARTGEAVGNVSHHLRVLADCGLVEEVPELARDRRERWWRLAQDRLRWSSHDFHEDPAAQAVEAAASSLGLERRAQRFRDWLAADDDDRARWARGPFSTDSWARMSDAELAELSAQVIAIFRGWSERAVPDDGVERRTVSLFAYGVPAEP